LRLERDRGGGRPDPRAPGAGKYALPATPEYVLDVPRTFHIVRKSNGTGGLTEEELDENIPVLKARATSRTAGGASRAIG
jgi:hypothetical protein